MRYVQGAFALELDNQTARLTALSFQGKELLTQAKDTPIFSLTGLKGDERVALLPTGGKAINEQTLVFETMRAGSEELPIRCELTLCENLGAIALRVHVTNNAEGYDVVETLFELAGLCFGEAEDTALLYPHHAGEKIINPANDLRTQKYMSFWRAGTTQVNGEWVRECNYCGLCSMSYMYLQNSSAGLYIGSHDERFPVTGLTVKTGGEDPKYLSLGFRVHKRIRPCEQWESGAFTVALSAEDWHAGAKRYRAYINPYLAEHKDPEFLKTQAALNQCYNFKRVEDIANRFTDIPRMWEEGDKRGINHMFIASWNRTGFDSYYPEYYPDMELGTALDFRRGISYLNERGGFATLYVNARLSDLFSDFHKRYLSKMQIENEKGEALTETYGPHTFTLNCPSDEQWQHELVDTCDFAAMSYGFKGIYLDQLASAEPFACYHEGHTHEDIGEFNQGYLKILDELRTRLRARDKDAYLMTENCGDIYSAYTWGNLTWNGANYDEFYNMFRYTFPEFVQVNMCNDRSWVEDEQEHELYFYSDVERCVLMGNILWLGITSRYLGKEELKPHFDYLLAATKFRQAIAVQVVDGTYVDDRYVVQRDEAIQASSFQLPGNEALLLVGDCHQQHGKVTFELPFAIKHIEAYDENECRAAATICHNRVTVTMNGNRLARINVQG
ncbi:MAG: DUF6259 domain-containing protein [Clostridia bacterium]